MRVTARAAGASGEWLPGSVSPVQAASAQLDPGHRTSASHSDIRTHIGGQGPHEATCPGHQ